MPFNFEVAGLLVGTIWLIGITILLFQILSHYNKLTKGATSKTLMNILDTQLKNVQIAQKDIDLLKERCDTIEKDSLLHIQKIGLLRFNPFKDTGGDQSFILSLVDGKNTGVVLSGLYSRLGTRWYAKRVIDGKGVEHDLSEEEKKALKEMKSRV